MQNNVFDKAKAKEKTEKVIVNKIGNNLNEHQSIFSFPKYTYNNFIHLLSFEKSTVECYHSLRVPKAKFLTTEIINETTFGSSWHILKKSINTASCKS